MTTDEENAWRAAAAAYDDGRGLLLKFINPYNEDQMKRVFAALNVTDIGAAIRLTLFIRRLREQQFLPQNQGQLHSEEPPTTPKSSNTGNLSENIQEGAIPRIRNDPIQPTWMETSAVELLEEGIREITYNKDAGFAPFIFLVQSMGYGKTKAVLDLAKKRHVVYLPCQDISTLSGDDGFWKVPKALRDTIHYLEKKGHDICEYNWHEFLKHVQKLAQSYSSAEELYNAQITADGKLGDFYQNINYIPSDSPKWRESSPIANLHQPPKKKQKAKKTVRFSSYVNAVRINDSSLVVCLDKASELTEESFRAFRRAAKYIGIIVIFSDTNASISKLAPPNDASCSLKGGAIGVFLPPIYRMPNFDLEWNPSSGVDDLQNLFKAGRPLWSSLLHIPKDARATNDQLNEMVNEVQNLLTRNETFDAKDVDSLKVNFGPGFVHPSFIAVFSCRFSLGYKSSIGSMLAKYNLGTIAFVSTCRQHVHTHFPSEPVLAEASIRYTIGIRQRNPVLKYVQLALDAGYLKPPRGDVGEMCAAALMGFTMDKIRELHRPDNENPFFYSGLCVDLHEFLKEFGCSENDMITRELKDWKINFTHFVRPARSTDRRDLEVMWFRRMAFYVQEGTRGLDLLIAIHHETHGYATLRVQVKNRAKFPNSKRNIAFTKLAPTTCPPFVENEKLSVCLLLCTKVEPHCALWDYKVKRQLFPAPPKDTRSQANQPEVQRFCLLLASKFTTDDNGEDDFPQRLLEISKGTMDETEDDFWRVDEPVLEWEKMERDANA